MEMEKQLARHGNEASLRMCQGRVSRPIARVGGLPQLVNKKSGL